MSNRHRAALLIATLTAGLTLTTGTAHADEPARCSTDADCAALGYTGELGYGVTEDKVRLYSDRYELASDDAADPVADCLTDQGYRGLPDPTELVIYAPSVVIEGCAGSDVR